MVAALGGGKAPTLEELQVEALRMQPPLRFRALMRPVIDKSASPEEVSKAAAVVEKHAAAHPAFARYLGTATRRIVNGGKLDNYGTPAAREYIRKWAKSMTKGAKKQTRGENG